MFLTKIFSIILICILASCGNSISQREITNQSQSAKADKLFLKMERTPCYGTCPAYVLTIEPDGKILFEGKQYTEVKGKSENLLSQEKKSQLITEIEKADFFSFKDLYTEDSNNCPATATDNPTVTISVKLNDKEKTIKHYLGCSEKYEPTGNNSSNIRIGKAWSEQIFPQNLYLLENKIDEIVETKRWIGERK
jgi:Domain of unknown function (DUF6438)